MSDPFAVTRPRYVAVVRLPAGDVGPSSRSAMRRPQVRTGPIGWPWRPQPHRRGPDRTAIDI